MKWFQEQGWEVHAAAGGSAELPYVDRRFELPIRRSPLKPDNLRAFRELKAIVTEHRYELIHCHTPMGGVLARLAARAGRRSGTKVVYTAHGFHFCKGAPLANWLLYYPIEKLLARHTDCLITINKEDYALAIKRRFQAGRIEHVHGVGVDTERFRPLDEERKQRERASFGYSAQQFLMFYAAEFNKNKNQQMLIRSLALIKDDVPEAKLLLAGEGPLRESCRELTKQLGVEGMVDFLGYRSDLERIVPMCDTAVASSLREGLPVNIMEAMACGLPIIASDNRGHRELVRHHENGWIVDPHDLALMANRMLLLARDNRVRALLGQTGREMVVRTYAICNVLEEQKRIYKNLAYDPIGALQALEGGAV
jgi:glycosyltransferase EpsD